MLIYVRPVRVSTPWTLLHLLFPSHPRHIRRAAVSISCSVARAHCSDLSFRARPGGQGRQRLAHLATRPKPYMGHPVRFGPGTRQVAGAFHPPPQTVSRSEVRSSALAQGHHRLGQLHSKRCCFQNFKRAGWLAGALAQRSIVSAWQTGRRRISSAQCCASCAAGHGYQIEVFRSSTALDGQEVETQGAARLCSWSTVISRGRAMDAMWNDDPELAAHLEHALANHERWSCAQLPGGRG